MRVAQWRIPATGAMELVYDSSWLQSPEARPLSLSLPLNFDGQPIRGERVGFFFDNLLPDSAAIRNRVRNRFHTSTGDAFDLLEAIGRDCVGALQLLPEGSTPDDVKTITVTPIDDEEVERLLHAVASESPLSAADEEVFRISIAGAQEKTALTWHDGRWCKPHGATPTTHLLKLPLGVIGGRQLDMRASLENEWLCARILEAFSVPVAQSELRTFGSTKALVVTRFDRAVHSSGQYWLRLPQEDLCQATATPSSRKYESDGGPGLVELARILQGSEEREEDLTILFRAQLLFWMLAATDGHAKNFSLRLLAGGRYRLTPLYDVLSAWPIVGRGKNQLHKKKLKLAMSVRGKNKHYNVVDIERRHFVETARACGLPSMDTIIRGVVENTDASLRKVGNNLPTGFPEEVFARITTELKKSAELLAASSSPE